RGAHCGQRESENGQKRHRAEPDQAGSAVAIAADCNYGEEISPRTGIGPRTAVRGLAFPKDIEFDYEIIQVEDHRLPGPGVDLARRGRRGFLPLSAGPRRLPV